MPSKITSENDPRIQELIGKKFNRLTLIGFLNWVIRDSGTREQIWECKCDCGNLVKISSSNIKKTKSCGCFQLERLRESITKHNGSAGRHPLYRTWKGMRQRCNSPKCKGWKNYGGRGVKICARWNDFALFSMDMGARPSPLHQLGRINNDGDYEPDNVRWETPAENMANTRHNNFIDHKGERLHLEEWARKTGLLPQTITKRIKLGWPMDAVMNPNVMTPSEKNRYGYAKRKAQQERDLLD